MALTSSSPFEIKASDLAGRICNLKTKTSQIETPVLLPVIHPVRQLVPCKEIRSMGYEGVMTNAYTTFRRLSERADEGIHKIIGFDGTVMTDSGGYQVLEFGSVDIQPEDMARFEERIGTDIAIILDKPTGLGVTREYAKHTVEQTLKAARITTKSRTREDIIWTLPIQGGKYIDLVEKSAKVSSDMNYGCFALGSPVEVMEDYDFRLLVRMIVASKNHLPKDKPFHLFGAGHPLIIPLAVALGCDMFDSASYMLYAKEDRYISSTGTIRLEQLAYLGCPCKVCSSFNADELRRLGKEERTIALARHNLYALKTVIEETKQAIWEGRLWEYVQSNSRNHPKAFEAFKTAIALSEKPFELGTPAFKDRGIFVSEPLDLSRPEITRYRRKLKGLDLRDKHNLLIIPETKTKPFLTSELYAEVAKLVSLDKTLVTCLSPDFGLIPAEISDIYPLSQSSTILTEFPKDDPIIHLKNWDTVHVLLTEKDKLEASWFREEMKSPGLKRSALKKGKRTRVVVSRTYKSFKRKLAQV